MNHARVSSRVVVTGLGLVSCLGNTLADVCAALRDGRSGIRHMDAWRERGFQSQVAGAANVSAEPPFARKHARFMGETARFAAHAAAKAIDDAGLDPAMLCSPSAGVIIGSGIGSIGAYDDAMAIVQAHGVARTPPYVVPRQ